MAFASKASGFRLSKNNKRLRSILKLNYQGMVIFMKKIVTMVLLLIILQFLPVGKGHFVMGENDVFSKIANELVEKNITRGISVAVFDFNVFGGLPKSEGRFAAEQLAHYMTNTGSFSVIERSNLSKVMEEQSLAQTGIMETGSAVKVGRVVSARLVISGSIYQRGGSKVYLVRSINTESASIQASVSVTEKGNPAPLLKMGSFGQIVPQSVTASSYLNEKHLIHYPENTIDGIIETAWSDGNTRKTGIGEWLLFRFDRPVKLEAMKIINGYSRTSKTYGDLYELNSVPTNFTIHYSTGQEDQVWLKYQKEWQDVFLSKGASGVTWVKLIITDEIHGRRWKDTCISEIEFYGY